MNNEKQKKKHNKIIKASGMTASTADELLYKMLMTKTIGEIAESWSNTKNNRCFVLCDLIISAVFDTDINMCNQIIKRIDGTVPSINTRDQYANLVGNAIEEVLNTAGREHLKVQPYDMGILAIAKVIVWISIDKPGKNLARRKDRTKAAEIVLNRIGGTRSEPVKHELETAYVRPSWTLKGGNDEDN